MEVQNLSVDPAIIEQYLPYIRTIAKKLYRTHYVAKNFVTLDDLIQEGCLGALDSIRRYRPGQGPFFAFAAKRVKGMMMEKYRRRDLRYMRVARFYQPVKDEILPATVRINEDEVKTLDARVDWHARWAVIEPLLSHLPYRNRYVLHGIYVGCQTRVAIGRELGVSPSRINQLHSEALDLIRQALPISC